MLWQAIGVSPKQVMKSYGEAIFAMLKFPQF